MSRPRRHEPLRVLVLQHDRYGGLGAYERVLAQRKREPRSSSSTAADACQTGAPLTPLWPWGGKQALPPALRLSGYLMSVSTSARRSLAVPGIPLACACIRDPVPSRGLAGDGPWLGCVACLGGSGGCRRRPRSARPLIGRARGSLHRPRRDGRDPSRALARAHRRASPGPGRLSRSAGVRGGSVSWT